MSADDTAKELIRIATTAGLSPAAIDLQAAKLDILVKENAALSTKVARLEIENRQLRTQSENFQPVQSTGDSCPYCRRATGELVKLKPRRHIGIHGVITNYYKYSNPVCGKSYDKQAWPKPVS